MYLFPCNLSDIYNFLFVLSPPPTFGSFSLTRFFQISSYSWTHGKNGNDRPQVILLSRFGLPSAVGRWDPEASFPFDIPACCTARHPLSWLVTLLQCQLLATPSPIPTVPSSSPPPPKHSVPLTHLTGEGQFPITTVAAVCLLGYYDDVDETRRRTMTREGGWAGSTKIHWEEQHWERGFFFFFFNR